jgi:hypothetical protein
MTLKEQIAVMEASDRGEVIQARRKHNDSSPWTVVPFPEWNWMQQEYRVMPNPRRIFAVYNNETSRLTFCYETESEAKQRGFDTIVEFVEVIK